MRFFFLIPGFLFLFTSIPAYSQDLGIGRIPAQIENRLKERNKALRDAVSSVSTPLGFAYEESKAWLPGETVRVAFLGGSQEIREHIELTAKEWTEYAYLRLSFRDGGEYREWSPTDSSYAGDIRISFDDSTGHWSVIGTDANNHLVVPPGIASMNFTGFDQQLPEDWERVVLHEFGHALGFHHEHQIPIDGCQREFRWYPDPGYNSTQDSEGRYIEDDQGREPGLYRVLSGPPYGWTQAEIDMNLREITASRMAGIESGDFDSTSIMSYDFGAWMFKNGEKSRCFSKRNLKLSEGDKNAAKKLYPSSIAEIRKAIQKRKVLHAFYLDSLSLDTNMRKPIERRRTATLDLNKAGSFPWEPPPASYEYPLPNEWLLNNTKDSTLKEIVDKLEEKLIGAGFRERKWKYTYLPNGFALIAHIERIGDNGAPMPGKQRWSSEMPSISEMKFRDFIKALLFAHEGYYRMFVFVVTDKPWTHDSATATNKDTEIWYKKAYKWLPGKYLRRNRYSLDHRAWVLVYEFNKTSKDAEAELTNTLLKNASEHLYMAGIRFY